MASDDFLPAPFDEENSVDRRNQYVRYAVRVAVGFSILFTGVYLLLGWSGEAVRFGASRVAARGVPTWHVVGTVRDAATREPIAWAAVDDDISGRPPFFHAEADRKGAFDLLTLAESHKIRISASGYHNLTVNIGRMWFLWLPSGKEIHDTELVPGETP